MPFTLRKTLLSAAVISGITVFTQTAAGNMQAANEPLRLGFTPIALVSPSNFAASVIAEGQKKQAIAKFCEDLSLYFKKYKWEKDVCGQIQWKADLKSPMGHPLIYTEFGSGEETTLLLSAMHPDELTPVPMAFRLARYLHEHPEQYEKKGVKVVIAPLVNPDGFLREAPTRGNKNGVDLNRNFFTLDWYTKSKKLWQTRLDRKARHFPGYFPNSEIETLFQIQLIDNHKPDKILSIHAPLGFLDYDGPGSSKSKSETLSPTEKKAKELVQSISRKSQNYRVVDYNFFPGSLGNYAGHERHIPTVTLEFKTADPKHVDAYWQQFLPGMLQSIHYPFTSIKDFIGSGNASPFSLDYKAHSLRDTI